MKALGQLAIILGAAYLGHILAAGLSAPLPAGVIGILLLLAALRLRWLPEHKIDTAASFLMTNMAFFFLPAAVDIIGNIELVQNTLFRLLAVIALSTAATFFATYHTACALQKPAGKKKAEQ